MNVLPLRRPGTVALFLVFISGIAYGQDPVLPEWLPEIEKPIAQLEGILDTAQNQQLINHTVTSLYTLHDARLYMLYHSWIDMLTGDERVQQLGEQRRWLRRRDEVADSAAAAAAGGTAAPMFASGAAIEFTTARYADLEARLTARLEQWEASRRKKK